MDNNEQIVRIWLETKGYLVKNRLKYKIKRGTSAGWCDIDLLAYNPLDGKRVAVDVTAWMTEKICFSSVDNPANGTYKRLHSISSPESRSEIRKFFNIENDSEYELWHVVSFISETQRDQVTDACKQFVDKVIEFPTIMKELIEYVKTNPNVTQETEALQTIRALVLCNMI